VTGAGEGIGGSVGGTGWTGASPGAERQNKSVKEDFRTK
jgi:hypothetical protein